MNQVERNQSGSGLVAVVLGCAAVIILGTVGWSVYQHNRTEPAHASTTSTQTSSKQPKKNKSTTPATQVTIRIPELGIQITVPAFIQDLTYRTSIVTLRDGNKATLAMFSTKALAALDSSCGTSFGPLGSLEKANGQYPTQNQDPTNVLDYGQLVKQFPTFYIAAGYPNAACSLPASAGSAAAAQQNNSTASTDKAAFSSSFSTLEALSQ